MKANPLLDQARIEIKLGAYGVAPASALADAALYPQVQDFRRQTGARMYPLGKDDIARKIPDAAYHVSRKVDGEFTVVVFRDNQAITLNPGGTVRIGLPCVDEAATLLSKAGIKEAMIAGELYAASADDRRPRVHDVTALARQPASADDLARLRFAAFDIVSLDGDRPAESFVDTWKQIRRIFADGELAHTVEARDAKTADDIEKLFADWVEAQGAEGLVVRSDEAGFFKVKPRHTLDAAVIGFTESTDDRQGLLHDLLVAVKRGDGTLQVLTRVGGGFSEDQRRTMLGDLKDMVVNSEYAEVNSDHVAYQMVHPEWVVEVSCLDLVSQTTRGGPVNRMVLDFSSNGTDAYKVVRRLPLAAVISPQFIRRREDKAPTVDDVRVKQVADLVEVPLADRDARQMTLPASTLLRREVFTKQLKGETMVRKFVMWKTNKETEADDFPAYVVHFTDFSPNRKAPLSREIRVSNSLDQINALWDGLKETNIKKGWDIHSVDAPEGPQDRPKKTAKKKPAKKVAASAPKKKKKAAKKKTG
jgi:hypothetical protein